MYILYILLFGYTCSRSVDLICTLVTNLLTTFFLLKSETKEWVVKFPVWHAKTWPVYSDSDFDNI